VKFNLISNLTNGVGLQVEFDLLRRELDALGHQVQGVQFNAKPLRVQKADVNLFLEVVVPQIFPAAPKNWVAPHPEWWFADWDRHPFDLVLAKTRDTERIFRARVGDRCQYVGWTSRDLYNATIPRQRRFLHVSGKSQMKNTATVIAGCQHAGVPLTVIGEHTGQLRRRVSDADLKVLMNSHFCQVMPSAYEGYGHVLHEAQGCGQIIITTDAPPMNELKPAVLIPSIHQVAHHAGMLHKVSVSDVAHAVRKVLDWTTEEVQTYHDKARMQYLRDQQAFRHTLVELVGHG